jgi:hypothetical protein
MKALSIRQPWAWLIVNGYKDIENRTWPTRFRGRVLIHASKAKKRDEYEKARAFAESIDPTLIVPDFDALARGGIVGVARITDCVKRSGSPWHDRGAWRFKLEGARPLRFTPRKGALGFFDMTWPLKK